MASDRDGSKLGLRFQLILALVVPSVLVLGAMSYFADLAIRRALENALGDRLSAVAAASATVVSPRVLLLDRDDDDSRTAQRELSKLSALATGTDVARILVIELKQDARTVLDSSRALRIGDEYVRARYDRAELERVRRGERVASVLFKGPDERWYKSGYAPLRDDTDSVVGAVVVHAPAEFFDVIDELRTTLAAIVAVALLALVVMAVFAARGVTNALSRLSASAERIGRGELATTVPIGGPREAAVLSRTMRKMANSLSERDEEMQLMLAGIAHEVRNPLGGIELFGGLLREDLAPDDPRQKHIDKILQEIVVLGGVVNDFLDFARKRPLEPKRTAVHELVEEVIALTSGIIDEKNQTVDVDIDASLEAIFDRDAVKRALLNLVSNAAQATPDGGTVRIEASARARGVRFIIRDTGPGIPEDKMAEIFTPFFTTKQKGTGLGLALVKKSVDAHGGTIVVDTPPDGGARFIIDLPELDASEAQTLVDDEPGLLGT